MPTETRIDKIYYEQPLNERIRTLLRLEYLFNQLDHHVDSAAHWDLHSAMLVLSHILLIVKHRKDLRTDLIKSLEKSLHSVNIYRANPKIDQSHLNQLVAQIEAVITPLQQLQERPEDSIKDEAVIQAILKRDTVPGGTCDFDIPIYHYWQHTSETEPLVMVTAWQTSLAPYADACRFYLKLLRQSSLASQENAIDGYFKRKLDTDQAMQLIRIGLDKQHHCYPEISASKHGFTVRFVRLHGDGTNQVKDSIPFALTCCAC